MAAPWSVLEECGSPIRTSDGESRLPDFLDIIIRREEVPHQFSW